MNIGAEPLFAEEQERCYSFGMGKLDSATGIPENIIYLTGRVIFYVQRIEQKLKRVIHIVHEMGHSESFKIKKIKRLTLGEIVKEVEGYKVFTENGMQVLRDLNGNRNYVSHEMFDGMGFCDERNKEKEKEIFESVREIAQKLMEFYHRTIMNVWQHYENEFYSFQYSKEEE